MDWRRETAAIIPCLNEEAAIRRLVPAVKRHVNAVCVVDDGSRDGTAGAAREAGAQVLRHSAPQGKGAALRSGWRWAQEQGFSWALTLDGDGQHAPSDIPAFFQSARQTHAPLTVGNRMHDVARMPLARRLTNYWMSRKLSSLLDTSIPDSQCGFRLIKLAALSTVALTATHFEIESDVLVSFVRAGYRVAFVPVAVIYRTERSKIRPVQDGLRWFRWWKLACLAGEGARRPAPAWLDLNQSAQPQSAAAGALGRRAR